MIEPHARKAIAIFRELRRHGNAGARRRGDAGEVDHREHANALDEHRADVRHRQDWGSEFHRHEVGVDVRVSRDLRADEMRRGVNRRRRRVHRILANNMHVAGDPERRDVRRDQGKDAPPTLIEPIFSAMKRYESVPPKVPRTCPLMLPIALRIGVPVPVKVSSSAPARLLPAHVGPCGEATADPVAHDFDGANLRIGVRRDDRKADVVVAEDLREFRASADFHRLDREVGRAGEFLAVREDRRGIGGVADEAAADFHGADVEFRDDRAAIVDPAGAGRSAGDVLGHLN